MTIKTLMTAAALIVASSAAYAACSGHSQQAMTCADGMVYDTASSSCKVVSG